MEMITEAVEQLHLELVDEEWVRNIEDTEYLEVAELSPIYESVLCDIDVSLVLGNIIDSVTLWLQDDSDPEERKSWSKLKKYIKLKKVLALLCYFMDRGTKDVLAKEYRDTAVLAARVYFTFMFISGYRAHDVYHSQIFVHSLACLSYPRLLLEFDRSASRFQEVNILLYQIHEYVTELHRVIVTLNLRPEEVHYVEILDCLLEVTGGFVANRRGVDQAQCMRIITAVYEMIDVMMKDSEGRPCSVAISHLFKTMLPKLLAIYTVQSTINLDQNYVLFIGLLISRYNLYIVQGLHTLLQHVCYTLDSLEKQDIRSARASLVINLMSLLPRRWYCKFVSWLLQMTTYSHVMHRHMALEILGKVLEQSNYDSLHELDESQESGISSDANISDSGESSQNDAQNTVVATVRRTSSSGIESQEVEEEPNTNRTLTDTRQTLHHKYTEILSALEECIEDVNCSVRMRALTLLTKCITSRRPQLRKAAEAYDKTGSGKRFMSIAMLMSNDERAMVKRAALDLLLQLIKEGDTDEESLKMLVNLCRDVSVQVRSATISALTEHCMSNPNPAVLDAFVSGPLHQLSDAEVKIQDQVVTSLKQIMIDTIKPYELTETNSQAWMLLAAITNRSKRNYLENACAMMSKKYKCINSKLIDILGTHLGKYVPPDRSLHALVLLSCAGKYVNHTNVTFLVKHVYNVGNSERNDCREITLSLELLSVWSDSIQESERNKLRSYIINSIETGILGANGSRPSCLTMARQLDHDNLQWVTEHMKTLLIWANSESPTTLLEKLADLSLVLPTSPPSKIIQLLMKKLAKTDLDPASSGIVVASIGRMCVRSYMICCRVAPTLGDVLLKRDGPLPPRVNALSVLEDICTKHSGIVEPLMNTICTCLEKEAPVLLRRKAARCITMLLLKQFLKLRTPLYYYYCALAMDSDTEVNEMCLNYVMYRLEPKVILNHFVDGVLYYNNSGPHASEKNSNYIDETSRRKLYDLLLSRLTDQQRLQVLCRLGSQVLTYAADVCDEHTKVETSLTEVMESAILDAVILINHLILKNKRGKAAAAELLDEDDDSREQTAEHSAMSPKLRRAIADSLVTGVFNLHSRIITTNSTLVDPLTRLGKDLMRDFKNEIDEYLTKDDMLSEQIVQFKQYLEKTPLSKARVHRGSKKETEPTPGPSRSGTRGATPGTSRSRTRGPTPGPSRKRTNSEFREPPSGSPRSTESIDPTPGPSRSRTRTESREPTPGPSRKRTSSEFRDTPSGSRRSPESIDPTPGPSRSRTRTESRESTPGPSRKRTSSEFREPPSGLRRTTESIDPTPGPSRSRTRTESRESTPGPSRKRTSSEFRDPPSGSRRTTESIDPTPGPSRSRSCTKSRGSTSGPSKKINRSEFRRPSVSSGNSESIDPTPGPSRKRTSSEFRDPSGSTGSSESLDPTPGPSKSRTRTESREPTPGPSRKRTSSEFRRPSASPRSSELIDPTPGPSRKYTNFRDLELFSPKQRTPTTNGYSDSDDSD